MRMIVPLSTLILAACQTAGKPAAPTANSWAEHQRDHPDSYIANTEAIIDADRQRLIKLGLERDHRAVRTAVDYHLPPGDYTLRATGATAAILRRQRVDHLTNWLIDLGYGASAVADPGRAKVLVQLAARIGGDGKGDAAKLTPTVALAEFVEIVTAAPDAAGRRFSTVRYRVIEPLKNAPPAGSLVRMPGGPTHYPDGTTGMSSGDLEMVRPGRYILYLSQAKMTRTAASPQSVDLYARVFGPLRDTGASFVPVGESSHPEVTLDDLRRAIRDQTCAEDHILVANGASPPQAC